MRKYIKLRDMSQESRAKYQAKRQRIDETRHDKEQQRLYRRHGQRWSLDPATTELCVIDGEADDSGHYNLFQAYSPSIGTQSLRAGPTGRLGLFECTRFLNRVRWKIRERTGKRTVFLGFAYGYDVNQQLFGETLMTEDERKAAWQMRSRTWGAVQGPHFTPELTIDSAKASIQIGRKTGYVRYHREPKHDIKIAWQDMFTLFAKSFVASIEEYARFWSSEEHRSLDILLDAVKEGKAARGKWLSLGYSDEKIALIYQEPELKLMHWLASKVVSLCKEVELYPKSLAGPAPIARALDRKYGVTSHIRPKDYESVEFQEGQVFQQIRSAFFGGNIQNGFVGLVEQYHSYDINSAHPAHICELPCGAHGHFVPLGSDDLFYVNRDGVAPSDSILHIAWKCPKGTPYGPFPVRRADNSTHYPLHGEGDYHAVEVQAFLDCYPTSSYNITRGILWVSTCKQDHPFEKMIRDTYDQRQVYKKSKNPAGNVLKLGMNSNFGIRAQTAGSHRLVDEQGKTIGYKIPKSSNLFLAGMITAGTRAQVMRMAAVDPENVLGFATDAVKFRQAVPLEAVESDDKETDRPLGGLEHEEITEPSYFVAPGVIFREKGDSKIRGCPANSTWWCDEKEFPNGFQATLYALEHNLSSIYSRADRHQNPFDKATAPENAGKFIPVDREIVIGPQAIHTKRDICGILQLTDRLWYLPPYQNNIDGVSKPYERPMDKGAQVFEREEILET